MMDSVDQKIIEVTRGQLQHFSNTSPPCQVMELPDGVLLRYTLARSLYFYLRTAVTDGKIQTRVFASDDPYVREKSDIGVVKTPMFEADADRKHFSKIEMILRSWVDFAGDNPINGSDFTSFPLKRDQG